MLITDYWTQSDRWYFIPWKEVCISTASSRGSTFRQYSIAIKRVRVTLSSVPSASVDGHFFRKDNSWRQSLLGRGDWEAKQNRHSAKSCLWSVIKSMSCCLCRSSPIACPLSSLSSSFWTSSWSSCWRIVVVKPETTEALTRKNKENKTSQRMLHTFQTLYIAVYTGSQSLQTGSFICQGRQFSLPSPFYNTGIQYTLQVVLVIHPNSSEIALTTQSSKMIRIYETSSDQRLGVHLVASVITVVCCWNHYL